MKLVIDRQKWLRGEDAYRDGRLDSKLRRARDGKMCCLGFLALACGFKDRDITGKIGPVSLSALSTPWGGLPEPMQWLIYEGMSIQESYDCRTAIRINDSQRLSDEEIEAELKEVFSQHGIEAEFIN